MVVDHEMGDDDEDGCGFSGLPVWRMDKIDCQHEAVGLDRQDERFDHA